MQAVKEKLGLASSKGAPLKAPSDAELNELKEKYTKHHQEHVFTFWDSLSEQEKGALYQQLEGFDPEYINQITDRALNPPQTSKNEDGKETTTELSPLPSSATASLIDTAPRVLDGFYNDGLDLIASGKVAVLLLAGGQGTRLGSSAPKGCYNIGLPSGKSLFQIQAERIVKVQELSAKRAGKEDVVVPWYVMTSGPTRGPTEEFFEKNNYFGLKKDNVIIFEQGVLPCISNDGKILLDSKSRVSVAPDGNGGIYRALLTSNARSDMRSRGIEHVHAYCVDNCLVKVADPVFVGFGASKKVDIATKVVRKRNAKESVGLILLKNGKPDVVEYSEIDSATAEAKDSNQPELLKFRAANIVNHYYSFAFLDNIESWVHTLPHHVARKKIPTCDLESGQAIKPEKPNGIKLEQFIFDVFPLLPLNKFASLEVKREDEFSPLKNAPGTGEDDPETSKRDIMQQGQRWVEAAGATVTSDGKGDGVEVSPLISYGGEGLDNLKGKEVRAPAVLEREKAV